MNLKLFKLINNLAYKNNALDKVMILFSKYVPFIFMIILAFVFIAGLIQKNLEFRKIAISAIVFTSINLLLSFFIGNIFYVDRPFVHNKVKLLFPHVKDASFPSDHATGTMSIALGIKKYNNVLSITLRVLSIMVGFSRVYVGHHYPLDVIGAYLIVFATGYIYNLKIRNTVENLYEIIEKKVISKLQFKGLYS